MIDREKVIKALEICGSDKRCTGCPYYEEHCSVALSNDALALLKEQEERIKQLESMNVTASGNGVAVGQIHGGLFIKR